ncbi:MAG TPA: YlbF family regulator [Spirochaetota bacterium]|nr:YlbF family regulator [Spirochaetota bacterium]
MEDILIKANELGLLIKKTDACKNFEKLSAEIEQDEDASSLLNKYNEIAETIQKKQESGDTVEKYEQEMFKALTDTVTGNNLILEYLNARDIYIDLLMKIHNSISGEK